MDLDELTAEASRLSEPERATLAGRLLDSLDGPAHHVTDEEVARRIREAESDADTLISFDELTAGVGRRGDQVS